MRSADDCAPTPLYPRRKKNFLDDSDTSSVSSGSRSRCDSISLSPYCPIKSSQKTSATTYSFLDVPTIKLIEACSIADEPELFPQDLYDRVDEYLDIEGLFITAPSPVIKPRRGKTSMTVVLSTSLLSKSGASTGTGSALENDSPFSDLNMPSFLVKRTISGGIKPKSGLGLMISQMRSEPIMEPQTALISAQKHVF